jgi:hypothetical protein
MQPWLPFQSVTAAVDSSRAHSGKFSVSQTAGQGSIYEDVAGLVAGARYIVSASVSASPDATATAQIAVYDPGANVATFSDALRPKTTWEMLSRDVTVSPAGRIRVHLFRNEGTGKIFWDDVHVTKAAK